MAAALLAIALRPVAAEAASAPSPAAANAPAPTKRVHTEFVVETNRKGQVTRVRSGRPSADPAFNAMTYGNALQAFIRTTGGGAVAGTYRLTYDYDPKTKLVKRGVGLIRSGGVDPSALGAVDKMAALDRKAHNAKTARNK